MGMKENKGVIILKELEKHLGICQVLLNELNNLEFDNRDDALNHVWLAWVDVVEEIRNGGNNEKQQNNNAKAR